MRHIFLPLFFSMFLFSCHQRPKYDKLLTIDPSIKTDVDKNVTKYTDTLQIGKDSIFLSNKYMVQLFINDRLSRSTYNNPRLRPFKSFYSWINDTLIINGEFDLQGNVGFEIEIINDTASASLKIRNNTSYKKNITDSIKPSLLIPSIESKVILSERPDKGNNKQLYGYVEFNGTTVFLQQNSDARKERLNMKAYFKSERLAQ